VERPYGKAFAVSYLLALPGLIVGVVTAFAAHVIGACIIGLSVVTLIVLANVLAHRLPSGGKAGFTRLSGYQIQWYHLIFGGEVTRALAVVQTKRNQSHAGK
jgi:hypothetical protein